MNPFRTSHKTQAIRAQYPYFPNLICGVCLQNTYDYSPFGVSLDGRTVEGDFYRYGFQKQEKDDELKGKDYSINYLHRMHDPRIGRFFAIDPLYNKFPFYSPYQFSGNRLLDAIELEGLEDHKLNNGEVVFGPYSGDYIDGFNNKYDRVINKSLVTSEIYSFNAYKKGESIVGNYLAKYIQKLPSRPKGFKVTSEFVAKNVIHDYNAAQKISDPGGMCYVVTASRINKAYEDLYGITPIDFTQDKDGKFRSPSYKAASCQEGSDNIEYGVGSPLIAQGLGVAVENPWDGILLKGAVIQYWNSNNSGHSQIFLNYDGQTSKNKISKMVLFDYDGYDPAFNDSSKYRTYRGTNLLDPK